MKIGIVIDTLSTVISEITLEGMWSTTYSKFNKRARRTLRDWIICNQANQIQSRRTFPLETHVPVLLKFDSDNLANCSNSNGHCGSPHQ